MKTLVLNVDRDDDFGRKANVKSPIVGIEANIDAANRLGQADPEDSDLNAIFSAISTYNQLSREGQDVEIATICGHINVGVKSDQILTEQLEKVVKETNAQDVILVTDGAEDEYILPVIQSRLKISSVIRVTVKQSKELQDSYYKILKLLDDTKVQRHFILPIALVIIVEAIFVLLDMTASGLGAILLTIGLYLLIRGFHWERRIAFGWEELKLGIKTGRLSIYTSIIAMVILIASGFLAYNNIDFKSESAQPVLVPVLSFVTNMIWGIVVAGLIITFGQAVDVYLRNKKNLWTYWIYPFSLFAFGFISYTVCFSLHEALLNGPSNFTIDPFLKATFIGYTCTGIMIAIVGAITYHYIKDMYTAENRELEIEEQVTKLVEKS